ncbi:MAG: SDR family oxidoreductase [Planctomycetota bacterium]
MTKEHTIKTVLITGASSGFGKLTAKQFQARGWNVIATMRTPDKEAELTTLENVLVTRLDVTEPASIHAAVEEGVARFGSIDALVNNAAYGGHALFEQASDESIRAMYDTNVFGVMNVSRAVLPIMRRQESGCIVNVTSMAGMLGAPTISIYASTKWAVEGLTEAMALEYKPLGIRVLAVAPGAYPTTRFNASTDDALDAGDPDVAAHARVLYDHIQAVAGQMAMQSGQKADPQEVADLIYKCATSEMPVHNPVGADARMLAEMIGPPRQEFVKQLQNMALPPQE